MAPTTNNKPCAQHTWTSGARFNKEVQLTLSLNLKFSVTEQLNCVSLLNSK